MNSPFRFLVLLSGLAALTWLAVGEPRRAGATVWQTKVAPPVLETIAAQGAAEFLILLTEQADLSAAAARPTRLEKGAFVYETLSALAARTQPPVIARLEALGAEYRSYWVVNLLWARGDARVVEEMARRADVAYVYGNPAIFQPLPDAAESAQFAPMGVLWNLALVQADQVWAEGITGEGAVIGGQDTGYAWDHPALKNQYRGWDGVSADHNYHWHDAIHEDNPLTPPGNPCGFEVPMPCDDNGHGTHTMGIMVGNDGGANLIGMAPGARWIGCRNMEQGYGTPATYIECYQWFIAPTDLNGENPDPAKAPHVINNSWSCPPFEGCQPDALLLAVQAVRAAGILTVHAAGNSGPNCDTVDTPAAVYDESFTVGSTNATDTISSFSSRGPSSFTNSLKPNVTAPGEGIYSSYLQGSYIHLSGTSMAAPHVAGLTGLLISANPALAGQVGLLEFLIEQTALPLVSNQECGGVAGNQIPNNTFGWGRIDAYAAYQAALNWLQPFQFFLPLVSHP